MRQILERNIYYLGTVEIRSVLDDDYQRWFLLRDVTRALRLPYETKITKKLNCRETTKFTLDGSRRVFVSAAGLLVVPKPTFANSKNRALILQFLLAVHGLHKAAIPVDQNFKRRCSPSRVTNPALEHTQGEMSREIK